MKLQTHQQCPQWITLAACLYVAIPFTPEYVVKTTIMIGCRK